VARAAILNLPKHCNALFLPLENMKMNKIVLMAGLLITFVNQSTQAQYYHKDIVTTKLAQEERKLLLEKKIRNILVHSFEGNGEAAAGFYCEKKINKDYSLVETFTKSNITGKSLLSAAYNSKGQLVQSTDSSELSASTAVYDYTPNGALAAIGSYTHSSDDDFKTNMTETRRYYYNEKGQPLKMIRKKNGKDSVQIDFVIDEKGNVTDEIEPGIKGRHYYYYYNAAGQLTDIVRYNVIKKELRADVVFEYDDEGRIVQMVTVEDGAGSDYYTWKYVYNDGLRIIEKCFSKEKMLLGYFEYEYE
jgi:hypothetical protein